REHLRELAQADLERLARRRLGGGAVVRAAGLEQRVGPAAQEGERLAVAAEMANVALDAEPLVGQRPQEPRPLRAPVARVAQRPERADVGVEVARAEGVLHLLATPRHLVERLARAPLRSVSGQERLEPE